MKESFFIQENEEFLGPVTGKQLIQLAKTGRISPETVVLRDSDKTKFEARRIKGLQFSSRPGTLDKREAFETSPIANPANVGPRRANSERPNDLPNTPSDDPTPALPRQKSRVIFLSCMAAGLATAVGLGIWLIPFGKANDPEVGKVLTKEESLVQIASNGDSGAQYELACLYLENKDAGSDSSAFEWLTKASDQKHAAAQYELARFFELGLASDPSADRALRLIESSAELGHLPALNRIVSIHSDGELGQEVDLELAKRWAETASKLDADKFQPIVLEVESKLEEQRALLVSEELRELEKISTADDLTSIIEFKIVKIEYDIGSDFSMGSASLSGQTSSHRHEDILSSKVTFEIINKLKAAPLEVNFKFKGITEQKDEIALLGGVFWGGILIADDFSERIPPGSTTLTRSFGMQSAQYLTGRGFTDDKVRGTRFEAEPQLFVTEVNGKPIINESLRKPFIRGEIEQFFKGYDLPISYLNPEELVQFSKDYEHQYFQLIDQHCANLVKLAFDDAEPLSRQYQDYLTRFRKSGTNLVSNISQYHPVSPPTRPFHLAELANTFSDNDIYAKAATAEIRIHRRMQELYPPLLIVTTNVPIKIDPLPPKNKSIRNIYSDRSLKEFGEGGLFDLKSRVDFVRIVTTSNPLKQNFVISPDSRYFGWYSKDNPIDIDAKQQVRIIASPDDWKLAVCHAYYSHHWPRENLGSRWDPLQRGAPRLGFDRYYDTELLNLFLAGIFIYNEKSGEVAASWVAQKSRLTDEQVNLYVRIPDNPHWNSSAAIQQEKVDFRVAYEKDIDRQFAEKEWSIDGKRVNCRLVGLSPLGFVVFRSPESEANFLVPLEHLKRADLEVIMNVSSCDVFQSTREQSKPVWEKLQKTFKAATGDYSLEGYLLRYGGDTAVFCKTSSGEVVDVEVAKLSDRDQRWLSSIGRKQLRLLEKIDPAFFQTLTGRKTVGNTDEKALDKNP